MIDWHAEQSDHFIGTAAAIIGAIAAGATASSSIYAAHKQGDAAEKSAQLQTDAVKYGADKQDDATQRAEVFQRQQAENAYQNAQTTQRANYDQAKARLGAIAGVGAQYGLSGLSMPDFVPGVDPHYDTGATPLPDGTLGAVAGVTPSGSAAKGDAAALKALLDAGADPQTAVAKFNQQYGRTTGNEAVYYDPSQHGGVATIGLPDAYLAKPGSSWDITQRSGAASPVAKATGTLASFVSPSFAALSPTTALPTPYQPGTIGAYLRRA